MWEKPFPGLCGKSARPSGAGRAVSVGTDSTVVQGEVLAGVCSGDCDSLSREPAACARQAAEEEGRSGQSAVLPDAGHAHGFEGTR